MFNPLFIEDDMVGVSRDTELSTGDWIALRRLAAAQSLTEAQTSRLMLLGLAEHGAHGIACSQRGRETLLTRP